MCCVARDTALCDLNNRTYRAWTLPQDTKDLFLLQLGMSSLPYQVVHATQPYVRTWQSSHVTVAAAELAGVCGIGSSTMIAGAGSKPGQSVNATVESTTFFGLVIGLIFVSDQGTCSSNGLGAALAAATIRATRTPRCIGTGLQRAMAQSCGHGFRDREPTGSVEYLVGVQPQLSCRGLP